MSTTAVYVVLAAGVSLALLAGFGIYAVRHAGQIICCKGVELFSCFAASEEGLPLPDDNLPADWRGHAHCIRLHSGLVRCSPINQCHSRMTRTSVPVASTISLLQAKYAQDVDGLSRSSLQAQLVCKAGCAVSMCRELMCEAGESGGTWSEEGAHSAAWQPIASAASHVDCVDFCSVRCKACVTRPVCARTSMLGWNLSLAERTKHAASMQRMA